jgi:hypothetical protein
MITKCRWRINRAERFTAGVVGLVLLAVALEIVVAPPQRRVALGQCPDAAAGCIVSVDSDLTTFAAVLVAVGAAAVLLALLGIRFNRVKVAGTEFGYEKRLKGWHAPRWPPMGRQTDPSPPPSSRAPRAYPSR